MTTSPKTTHAETAQGLLDAVHDWQEHEGETDATMLAAVLEAQTVATFALEAQIARLADEARTANLIALWDMGGPAHVVTGLDYHTLTLQTLARLDLTQDVTP